MQGYGRGARMKIERDRIEWLSGLRAGETLGSPVAMLIQNRDWANWEDVMAYEAAESVGELRRRRVTRPRPGHADLAGVLKYDRIDARDILERASARETTARVAAAALAKRLLDEFGVEVGSHVTSIGGIALSPGRIAGPAEPGLRPFRGAGAGSGGRGRDHPADRCRQAGRRHPGRRGGSRGPRRSRGARQPRELGPEAGRAARRNADVDSRREGRGDRDGIRGGPAAGVRGARSYRGRERREGRGKTGRNRKPTPGVAFAGGATMPEVWRAGSPPGNPWLLR